MNAPHNQRKKPKGPSEPPYPISGDEAENLKSILSDYRRKRSEHLSAIQALATLRDDAKRLEAEVAKNKARQKALNDAAVQDTADAILSGRDLPNVSPELQREYRQLERHLNGAPPAQAKLATLVKHAIEVADEAEKQAQSSALHIVHHMRQSVSSEFKAKLQDLTPLIAQMKALDIVQVTLCGPNPKVTSNLRLWSGDVVASNFIKTLPARLTPDAFTNSIEAKISGSIQSIVGEITGDPQ